MDCMEEFVKYSIIMMPHFHLFGDRFSERIERLAKQEEKRRQAAVTEDVSRVVGTDGKRDAAVGNGADSVEVATVAA